MIILSITVIVIKQTLDMVNMNKRMRLQSSSDEDCGPPASFQKTSVIIPMMSTTKTSVERGDKENEQKERAEEFKQKFDKVEADNKELTEKLHLMRLVLSVERDKVRDAEELKKKFDKVEEEKKELAEKLHLMGLALSVERNKVRNATEKIANLERKINTSRKGTEKAIKEKDEAVKDVKDEARKIHKNVESINSKNSTLELNKEELLFILLSAERAKVSDTAEKVAKLERDLTTSRKAREKALELEKEELLDNFWELAEIELQCAVCTEVFLDAYTLNCGHTFCHYCINKWQREKSSCPVCRTEIKHMVEVKTLDQFVDKMYGQFVSENRRAARTSLQEERLKNMRVEYFRWRWGYGLREARERRRT